MGNSPAGSLTGQDQPGALTGIPLDQLEAVKPKAKPLTRPIAASTSSLSVPLEQLEPAQPKTPGINFDALYGKPPAAPRAENPFGVSTMTPAAAKPTPTAAAARVTEPQVTLAPPENPKPPSEYWQQEWAARQRDVEKINQAEQSRQAREQQEQERQREISRMPFMTRAVESMLEPSTALGTVLRSSAQQEKPPEFESDYFRHRAKEAETQGKSAWNELPRSMTEILVRGQNPQMKAEEARRIAEPFTQPLVDVPTMTGHTAPIAVGAERALGGFTSPENLALLGALGSLDAAAQTGVGIVRHAPRVISGLFATQTGAGLVHAAREYQSLKAAGDEEGAQKVLGSAFVQAPLALLMAYHAGTGVRAPMKAEELLDTVHAADTVARTSAAGAAPAEALPPAAKPVTVSLDELTPLPEPQPINPQEVEDMSRQLGRPVTAAELPEIRRRLAAEQNISEGLAGNRRDVAGEIREEHRTKLERGGMQPTPVEVPLDQLTPSERAPISLEFNFPLARDRAAALRDLSEDSNVAQIARNAGVQSVLVDSPHTFDLSQQGGVTREGVVRLNPNADDLQNTFLHELGEIAWGRSTPEEQTQLRNLAEKVMPTLERRAPGYARLASEGTWNEAVAEMFGMYRNLPLDVQKALRSFVPSRPFESVFPETQAQPREINASREVAPRGGRSWEDVQKNSHGYLTQGDDLRGMVRDQGDRMVVVKDVNGGRHLMPASIAARALQDPVVSGNVGSVFLARDSEKLSAPQLDEHTLQYIPGLREGFQGALREVEAPQSKIFGRGTPEERSYEDAGKKLGIEYRGVMGADMDLGDKAVVIYQDPESKTSVGVKVGEWSPERVEEKLTEARERMKADPTAVTLYGGLGFLDPELIRKVMPESIKNALAENVSVGEREAGIVREKTGELARKKEQAFQHYADAMARWEKRPVDDGRAFILREQHGEKQPNADDQAVADELQKEFAARRKAVEDLSHGSFDHWKEHYFPQMWERPTKIADWVVKQIMGGKRPLQGPAGFRKARVFEDIQEGLDAGFKPITNNPVTMALLKLHEMDRYTMAHGILGTMKEEDLAKAVMVGDHAPEGWTRISDGISTIYGDRNIPIKEYYDEAVLSKLSDTAKNLGIEHERAVRIGGSRLGYTSEGSNRIVTRFATPEAVIAHEIGHQLDWKYGLKDQLVKDPRYKLELRKLVDLKFEGREPEDVPASFRAKIRKGEEKMATIVEALVQAPDKFQEVAPNTWAFLQKLIANNPELEPLLEAKPSLVYGQRRDTVSAGGMVIRGYYYAPAEAARVLNNYLGPGLRGNPLYDLFRGAGNTLNQAQLGFSAFHAMMSGINSTISDFALALRKASTLSITEAAKASARAVTLVASPIRHVITGTKLMQEYLSPGKYADYSELADAVAKGGGRIYQDPLYRNASIAKFWKAWGEGDWKRVGLEAFPAALEKMASPVMEHLVPRLKLGAFADMARNSLDRLPPGAGKAEIRAALDKAWDSIDNRFGQVVYDNLFINKTLKDLGLVSVRSLGWNLGTVRELGGGVKDLTKAAGRIVIGERPQFTDRIAYTMALPIITGYIGALVNYAYTGQGPQELRDYFFPKTGRTLANGEPERISLPTYMKDVYAFAKHPLITAGHKVHPLISMIADMLQNKDFYGVEIRHADDPLVKQVKQIAGYAAEQASPLSWRNLQRRAQAEGRTGVKGTLREAVSPAGLQSFFGITPAPASVTHTAAEEKALDILERIRPKGTRTSEEYDRQVRRSYLRGELAAGRMKPQDLAARVQAGEVTPKEAGDILRQVREAPIVHFTRGLSLEDFLSVWDVANAREQEQLRPLLISKRHLIADLPAGERIAMAKRLNEAIEEKSKAPYLNRQQ